MNNKGFAITGILYGLMVLFMMLMLSFLSVLTAKKGKLETITNSIDDSITMTELSGFTATNVATSYTAKYRGNYIFTINSNSTECSIYLPSNANLTITGGVIKVNDKDVSINNCNNSGITSITIKKIYK